MKQAAEVKHKLSAYILDPYFSCTVYLAKLGIKMHALNSCFISAAWFSTICDPLSENPHSSHKHEYWKNET